jgi:DNA-binding NarL/FixJ family response regulator
MTIRTLIVEDHALVSEGLGMMLSLMSDVDLVGVASTGEQALELIGRERVELVLMDVNLGPGISGIETTKRIREVAPEVKILVLTMFTDASTVTQAVKAGANGYLSKGATRDIVERAIADVLAGRSVLDPAVTKGVFGRLGEKDPSALSQRELEILQELSNGRSTKEVAENVFLSEETVKTYLKQIFRKLGVRDRTEAVAEALRHGIVH